MRQYRKGPLPEDPYKDNESLYKDYRTGEGDLKKRRYTISKTIKVNWDSMLEKWWKKIFRK